MKNKIKLSVGLILSVVMLFSFFAVTTPVSASTCDSATLNGSITSGTLPIRARFTYSTDYNTVFNGGGTPTTVQTVDSYKSIQQVIYGLTASTTYYFRLELTNSVTTTLLSINNVTTLACSVPVQNPTVTLYASPTSINSGQIVTLSWSSQNTTSCSISQIGNVALTGYQNIYPTYTTTYTITCYGTNGQQVSDSTTVYVNQIYVNQTQSTCRDTTANNYGAMYPCMYNNYTIQTCQDINANNYRGVFLEKEATFINCHI